MEPSELLTEEPKNVPEGMVSIKVPGRGYALGKLAQVVIKVPESVPLGSTGEITVAASAAWLGQSGAAAVKQARDFDFSVTIVSGSTEYTETIVGKVEKTETEEPGVTQSAQPESGEGVEPEVAKPESGEGAKPEVAPPTSPQASESGSVGASLIRWLPAIIAGVVVVLAAILIPIIVRRRD